MDKHSRLNRIYKKMVDRCYNPKHDHYKYYGARGIGVCEEWLNRKKDPYKDNATLGYLAFKEWALSHGYDDDLTIDRIDNNKGYSPNNCRWVTHKFQQNNRRNNHYVTYKDKTQTLMQWCEELNLDYYRIIRRLYTSHWSVERAFETKKRKYDKQIKENK